VSPPDTVADETPRLRLDDLSVERGGRPVVAGVSLEIPPGQVTALLGANGAGKSSLVLAVGGLLRKSGGRVLVGDRELTRLRPEQVRAAGVAVVPEGRPDEIMRSPEVQAAYLGAPVDSAPEEAS